MENYSPSWFLSSLVDGCELLFVSPCLHMLSQNRATLLQCRNEMFIWTDRQTDCCVTIWTSLQRNNWGEINKQGKPRHHSNQDSEANVFGGCLPFSFCIRIGWTLDMWTCKVQIKGTLTLPRGPTLRTIYNELFLLSSRVKWHVQLSFLTSKFTATVGKLMLLA